MNEVRIVSIGHNLKRIRKEKKYSQIEVSKAIGINQATLSRYENYSNGQNPRIIVKLAEFYGVTIDEIYGDNPRNWLNSRKAHTR